MDKKILEKATELFLKQGFKTVTMDDIANDLAISKKTIYQHYSSKPELIEKSLASINANFLKLLETTLSLNQEAIPELLNAHKKINDLLLVDSTGCFYQLSKYYPKLAHKQKVFHEKKYVKLIEANIIKGITEGVYRADIDIDFISRFHIASLIAVEDLDYFPESEYAYSELHALHLEYFIRSIATEEGRALFLKLKKEL
ncbi:TetR/AcrR family transcriptional regulator [Myroides pelagicus]|uniref:TetR family transcriptional regulator n=1 Tax=Myroides pelagicus TaxID=270914 RepID=A0A7K1GID2_9FLAO|nr:TetR/AcrR family transcriptional regulator [Myroides pelagicus]MEC4112788.1 helix-turn-helix domain-containing protein [Myroides pelagicus]MTH28598.1 TetR family transcriptional regulator [Myroides pelagicus]